MIFQIMRWLRLGKDERETLMKTEKIEERERERGGGGR